MVFDRLLTAKLKLSPDKSQLCQKEVLFLGHVVSETDFSTDPNKIMADTECN